MFTLLWEDWFREWMENERILPDTQNGFRRGYHGLGNPFILRCAIETVLCRSARSHQCIPMDSSLFPLGHDVQTRGFGTSLRLAAIYVQWNEILCQDGRLLFGSL